MESVDTPDLKSVDLKVVRVQVSPLLLCSDDTKRISLNRADHYNRRDEKGRSFICYVFDDDPCDGWRSGT